MTGYLYNYKSGIIDSSSIDRFLVSKYNDQGVPVEKIAYHNDTILRKVHFNFNQNIIVDSLYKLSGEFTGIFTMKLDVHGNLIERKDMYDGQTQISKYIRKYDDNGRLVEEELHSSNSDPLGINGSYTTFLFYDSSGRKTGTNRYEDNGKLSEKKRYKYDQHGYMIEEIRLDNFDNLIYRHLKKYDANGNMIEWLIYTKTDGEEKLLWKSTARYDKYCNKVEEIFYDKNNQPSQKFIYKYIR